MSCLGKASPLAKENLFPEDSIFNHDNVGRIIMERKDLFHRSLAHSRGNYRHMTSSMDSWLKIVEAYTRCSFTTDADKIVARRGLGAKLNIIIYNF